MKIGTKLGIMLSILLAYWFLFSIVIAASLIFPDFTIIEEKEAFKSVSRCTNALKHEQRELKLRTEDLAYRDETLQFMDQNNPNFVSKNIPDRYFKSLNLHDMIFFKNDFTVFWSYRENHQYIPQSLIELLKSRQSKFESGLHLSTTGSIFFFSIAQIQNSEQTKMGDGQLMTIRLLDKDLLAELNTITNERFIVSRVDSVSHIMPQKDQYKLDKSLIELKNNPTTPVITHFKKIDYITNLIPDFNHEYTIKLEIKSEGEIRRIGISTLHSFIISVILTSLFITTVQGFFLNRMISTRLLLFKQHIKDVSQGKKEPFTLTKRQNDEIDELSVEYDSAIRALKSAEKQKERLQQKLHHSQKMEAVGQLAGGIAHIFNNNLQAIIGFTELIKKDNEDQVQNEQIQNQTEIILKASHHCAFLTRQMLTFSKSGNRSDSEFYLKELIENATNVMQENSTKMVAMIVIEESPEILIKGDYMQLQNVIINILINAFEAIDDNGKIDIRSYREGNKAIITIKDNGKGISPEINKNVFDPFFTTKRLGEGTGMGLAEAYAIVKNHQGTIDFESEPGRSTEFIIKIPAIDTDS